MKNLKVSMKLILGFIIVCFITLAVGVVGIVGMYSIEDSYTKVLKSHAQPLPTMGHALESLQMTRVDMRNAMLYTGQLDKLQSVEVSAQTNISNFESYMQQYRATIESKEAIEVYDETQNQYQTVYKPTLLNIISGAKQGMAQDALYDILNPVTPVINDMTEGYSQLMDLKLGMLNTRSEENQRLFISLIVVLIIIIIASITIAMFMGIYIAGLISKPINALSGFMKKAATSGDISVTAEENREFDLHMKNRDEIGQLTTDCGAFIDRITEVANELEYIANGDLTVEIKVLSSLDTMGNAMKKTVENLSSMFVDINTSSEQVSTGASQISDGAQQLASGSTQQAATLEELSASIADVAEKTKENAQRTHNASVLADNIMQSASKGSSQMEQMINAVNDINQANQDISKVIKAIDDIAFQTNILALNAAVEAARAGAAGKGFAVVAEEVRNLAAKSAESAKDTSGLIANSMEKAELGTKIAAETAESLAKIVSGISESNRIILEIAQASEQQTSAIEQINIGVGGVTQVVQQNSATAEQSAAASEEMNGQANLLEDLVSKFKIK